MKPTKLYVLLAVFLMKSTASIGALPSYKLSSASLVSENTNSTHVIGQVMDKLGLFPYLTIDRPNNSDAGSIRIVDPFKGCN